MNTTSETTTVDTTETTTVDTTETTTTETVVPVDMQKLFEGISFADTSAVALNNERTALVARRTMLEATLRKAVERLAEIETALSASSEGSVESRREKAVALVSQMRAIGLKDEAIRSTLKIEFGTVKPNANRPATPPAAGTTSQDIKIKESDMSLAAQKRVLEILSECKGANGVSVSELAEALKASGLRVGDTKNVSAVLKNARNAGVVDSQGLARGTTYSVSDPARLAEYISERYSA